MELDHLQEVVEARTVAVVAGVLRRVEEAARQGWTAAGFVAYEAAPAFDPAFAVPPAAIDGAKQNLPLAWFGLFASSREVQTATSVDRSGSTIAQIHGAPSAWTCDLNEAGHRAAVGQLHQAIGSGETYLTNLTTQIHRTWDPAEDPFVLYQQLASQYASGQHAYLETDEWVVVSGSPELFFDLRHGTLTVKPMKGTARRGRWTEEDLALAEELSQSSKERAENVMVVDLMRNDLGRIAQLGTVRVPSLCSIERHPSVWQLTSTVTAEVRSGAGLPEVFGALFPCASVTGAPKVSTMRLIADLETTPRGVYCGAIGYVRCEKGASATAPLEARFSVAIRTAVIDKVHRQVTYGTGGGITVDSDPAAEWRELLLKAHVLQGPPTELPDPAALLETLRFDPRDPTTSTSGIRNLDRHLRRLRSSADHLGRPCPPDLEQQLQHATTDLGPARLRLLVHPDATVTIEHHPLPPTPAPGVLARLCVDHLPVDPDDIGLFHKTTDRHRYDERTGRHPHADDVILVNTLGDITETTRANLAVKIDDRWCTPPIGSGLLPGVERGRLIDAGELHERSVSLSELRQAEEIATLSSLRGWSPAVVWLCPACTGSA